MSDIVDRLRDQQTNFMTPIFNQAADEIDLLRGLARFLLDDDANGAMAMMAEHDSLREL